MQSLVLDLGNSHSSVSSQCHRMRRPTALVLDPRPSIPLDALAQPALHDLLVLLGLGYEQQPFSSDCKYYKYDFVKSEWGRIGVQVREGTKSRRIHVETLLALYVRCLLADWLAEAGGWENVEEMLGATRVYVAVGGRVGHRYRFGLKQVCDIAGIQNPVLVDSNHLLACSYYSSIKLAKPTKICVLQFGGSGTCISVYKLQPSEQNIMQVLETTFVNVGGYHLTKLLAEHLNTAIKSEKKMDISKYAQYMSELNQQCEIVKLRMFAGEDRQGHVRLAKLPDGSEFGRVVDEKLWDWVVQGEIGQVVQALENVSRGHQDIDWFVFAGGSCSIPLFRHKVGQVINQKQIIELHNTAIAEGLFQMLKHQMVMFDTIQSDYTVTGEEGYKRQLISRGQDIPDRRIQPTKFPAGELEFNLRVFENKAKVAHFTLEARPAESLFGLNFQIDRNKLIKMEVLTKKGKSGLLENYLGIPYPLVQAQKQLVEQWLK